MNEKTQRYVKIAAGIAASISLGVAGICLMIGCLSIYRSGAFTPDAVAQQASRFALPLILSLVLTAADIVICLLLPPVKEKRRRAQVHAAPNAPHPALKLAVVSAAVILALVGFFTGGTVDVLTKAVNICTECVGLG